MSGKPDNFWGGFLLGAVVGATVGAIVAIKLTQEEEEEEAEALQLGETTDPKDIAYTLEEKISQLNAAIDAVSAELSSNGKRKSET